MIALLDRAELLYEALVGDAVRAFRRGNDEATLRRIGRAARFASFVHCGRFVDARLESMAVVIGEHVDSGTGLGATLPLGGRRRRLVHVATTVLGVGGHSRLIANWVRADSSSSHRLILTAQGAHQIPPVLASAMQLAGAEIELLCEGQGIMARARALRRASAEADAVVLHTHQDDVVPLVAFARPGGPPVVLMNHADHMFWLGASIADTVAVIRPYADELSRTRRQVRRAHLLPIPIQPPPAEPARMDARRSLGIGPDEVLLLSMGSAHKYAPTARHDFFSAAAAVLEEHPVARLVLVGVRSDEAIRLAGGTIHPRLTCVGAQPAPLSYQRAADLYLEGFPIGSLMALLESVVAGACPVLMFAPAPHQDESEDAGLRGFVTPTSDAVEWVAHVGTLVQDAGERRRSAHAARHGVLAHHSGGGWQHAVSSLYAFLDGVRHETVQLRDEGTRRDSVDVERARETLSTLGEGPYAVRAAAVGDLDEILPLLRHSLAVGDTRPRWLHLREWLSLARRALILER